MRRRSLTVRSELPPHGHHVEGVEAAALLTLPPKEHLVPMLLRPQDLLEGVEAGVHNNLSSRVCFIRLSRCRNVPRLWSKFRASMNPSTSNRFLRERISPSVNYFI